MNNPMRLACAVGALVGLACSPSSKVAVPVRGMGPESVMTRGMIIEASNRYGRIRIEAGRGTQRTFSWEGGREVVRLWERDSRWYGSRGLYHPGGGRRVHLVVEEGQQLFCSENEANEWLLDRKERMDWSCSPTGLVVGWYKTKQPDRDYWAVIVAVWQVYVNGRKPSCLSACRSCSVRVTGEVRGEEARQSSFVPSEPQRINGRLYSGRAQDVMRDMDIALADVEATMADGDRLKMAPPMDGWKSYAKWTRRGMCIVTVDANGRVVDVRH